MAYSAPSTRSTSDLITAAIWNADLVANEIAIYAGALSVTSQAVGDILYASSTTQFTRIAAVAAGQVLGSAGTGTVPAYSATPALTSVDMGGTTVYGSRAITVDTGGVLNVVLASSAGDDFTVDTDKLVVSGDTGDIGIGVAAPQAKLHILSASAGTHTPHSSADELVIEGSSSTGLTIVTPDAQTGFLAWSSPTRSADFGCRVSYNYDADTMTIGQIAGGAKIALKGANTGIGTLAPISLLDVRGPVGTGATPAGLLTLATNELTVVDGDQLGRLEFRSPIATAGTDAIVSAAAIWVEANATFSASVNSADIVFATAASGAATEKMRILSSGNVGIGTSTPGINFGGGTADYTSGPTLEINGGTRGALLISGTTDAQLLFGDAGNSADEQKAGIGYDSGILSLYHVTDANYGRSAPGLSLLNSGSVGIGTAAPAHTLAVKGGVNNGSPYRVPIATFQTASYDQWLSITGDGSGASGGMGIQYGVGTGVPELFITTGKVGINNTSPSHALHVKAVDADIAVESTTGTNSTSFQAINTGGTLKIGLEENTGGILVPGSGAYNAIVSHSGAYAMGFATSNIRRLDIASGGTVHVFGTFTAGTKTFQIPHPLPALKDTNYLIHGCLEGPRLDLIYRGTVTLVDGVAAVDLDDAAGMTAGTWALLCRDAQVFTTNETGWFHVRGTVSGSTLTIECEEGTCTDTVSWMVVAERQDDEIKAQSSTDEDGHLILEPLQVENPSASASPSA